MTQSFENGLKSMMEQMDAPIASFLSSCVHCGLCAEACLFYTETGDPKYTPIHKLEPLKKMWRREYTLWGKLGGMVGLFPKVTAKDFEDWEELVYDSCTMCGRCSMVCPVGNDITYMIRKIREGFSAAGYVPEGMAKAGVRAMTEISPIGIKPAMVAKQCEKQSKETGLPIEMDKAGVDYMVLLSSMEVMGFPEIIGAMAKIFHHAGITWTISSKAYEATNIGIQIGNKEVARALVQRVYDEAVALRVKGVISPECGHAYQAIRWDGPNLLGKAFPFEVIHLIDLLGQLQAAGKLPLTGKYPKKITYHDPCQLNRRGGLDRPANSLIDAVAENCIPMEDAGAWGWCCGGGGGVSANHRAEELRYKVFAKKKHQIEKIRPEELLTTCANCRNVIEEALDEYEMNLPVIGLTELLADYLDDGGKPGESEQ
ncbi:(Fe-S)-binding protein [Magnetospira thiophila]